MGHRQGAGLPPTGSPLTGGAFDLALLELFEAAVTYGRAKSTTHPIPASFDTDLDGYAAANPADGKILTAARARQPTIHNGGLVPSDALAMTLDTDVFCGSGSRRSTPTFTSSCTSGSTARSGRSAS